VPEDERPEYVKPDFLKKAAMLDPLAWLPKIQAKKFRLDDQLFDTETPKSAKEKLRAAVFPGASVMFYKNMDEFKAAFQDGKNLRWIQHELASLPEAATGAASPSRP